MRYIMILLAVLGLHSWTAQSQSSEKDVAMQNISEKVIAAQLEFLASDWTEGRETGEKGAYMAADYIASMFKVFGLQPGGDFVRAAGRRNGGQAAERGYFQNFNLLEYRTGDDLAVSIISENGGSSQELILDPGADFTLTAGSRAIHLTSELVFIGYGFEADDYNDFKGVDVKNKILVRLPGFPGHQNPDSEAFKKYAGEGPYAAYRIEREKDQMAAAYGAAAVIEWNAGGRGFRMTPDNVPFRYNETNWEGTEPRNPNPRSRLTFPGQISQSLTRIVLAPHILEILMKESGIDVTAFEEQAEKKGKTASVRIPDKRIRVATSVESRIIQARNVVGVLEGRQKDTCIVVGAHYDHVGQIRTFIYNGSDDNASGTVGMMTIAKAMVETGVQPEYTLVFCAWTAEEKGLIGSAWYADHPLIDHIKCYMNYDMISRVAPDDPNKNKCDFQYTSTVPLLRELTENHIKSYGINLDMAYKGSEMPLGGSDFSSFSRKGIPIFLLHGKFTPDYHQPTDHFEKADLTYMRDIVRVGFLNIYELSTNTW